MKHFGIIYLTTQTELSLKILCYSHIKMYARWISCLRDEAEAVSIRFLEPCRVLKQ